MILIKSSLIKVIFIAWSNPGTLEIVSSLFKILVDLRISNLFKNKFELKSNFRGIKA